MRFTGKNLRIVHDALLSLEMETRNMLVTAPEHEVDGPEWIEYQAEHLAVLRLIEKVQKRYDTKGEKA